MTTITEEEKEIAKLQYKIGRLNMQLCDLRSIKDKWYRTALTAQDYASRLENKVEELKEQLAEASKVGKELGQCRKQLQEVDRKDAQLKLANERIAYWQGKYNELLQRGV